MPAKRLLSALFVAILCTAGAHAQIPTSNTFIPPFPNAPKYATPDIVISPVKGQSSSAPPVVVNGTIRTFHEAPNGYVIQCFFFEKGRSTDAPKGIGLFAYQAAHYDGKGTNIAFSFAAERPGSVTKVTLFPNEEHPADGGTMPGNYTKDTYYTGVFAGWIVRVLVDGKLIYLAGSNDTFTALGKTSAEGLDAALARLDKSAAPVVAAATPTPAPKATQPRPPSAPVSGDPYGKQSPGM